VSKKGRKRASFQVNFTGPVKIPLPCKRVIFVHPLARYEFSDTYKPPPLAFQ